MTGAIRRAWIAGCAGLLGTAVAAPSLAQHQPDARPPCTRTLIAVDETIDSSRAKAGDVFRFQLAEDAVAPDGTAMVAGTKGYGVVANASHADRGGRPGYLALEARFFALESGKHVPAMIDRVNEQGSTALGASANAPGLLGMIPIVGYAVGGYDALHHGRDATIPRGTRIGVFIGDDAALGSCRAPVPGDTPAPLVTASPSVAPSVTATAPTSSPSM